MSETVEATGWWLSWYHESRHGSFELSSPWWISGSRSSDGALTVVAAVLAPTDDEAISVVTASYDKSPDEIEFRFVEPLLPGQSPFSDRFPRADWMVWPPDDSVRKLVAARLGGAPTGDVDLDAMLDDEGSVQVEQGQDVDLEHLPPLPSKWSAPLTEQSESRGTETKIVGGTEDEEGFWHDDGHRVESVIEGGELRAEVHCPHWETDWSQVTWADRPTCRRSAGDEHLALERQWSGSACLVQEYVHDDGLEGDGRVVLGSVPVRFAWYGETVDVEVQP